MEDFGWCDARVEWGVSDNDVDGLETRRCLFVLQETQIEV